MTDWRTIDDLNVCIIYFATDTSNSSNLTLSFLKATSTPLSVIPNAHKKGDGGGLKVIYVKATTGVSEAHLRQAYTPCSIRALPS